MVELCFLIIFLSYLLDPNFIGGDRPILHQLIGIEQGDSKVLSASSDIKKHNLDALLVGS